MDPSASIAQGPDIDTSGEGQQFGAGCFWGVELAFQRIHGVTGTELGYSQGTVHAPTYKGVCSGRTGHAEIVRVRYDTAACRYEDLLAVFWGRHDPTTLNRQVLHSKSMRPTRESDVPVRVKNSYNKKSPCILITKTKDMSKALLTSIVLKSNITMLDIVSTRMLGQFGFLARVLSNFEDLGISLDTIATSELSISLTLDASKVWSRELIQRVTGGPRISRFCRVHLIYFRKTSICPIMCCCLNTCSRLSVHYNLSIQITGWGHIYCCFRR